jgi:hypothetical protein
VLLLHFSVRAALLLKPFVQAQFHWFQISGGKNVLLWVIFNLQRFHLLLFSYKPQEFFPRNTAPGSLEIHRLIVHFQTSFFLAFPEKQNCNNSVINLKIFLFPIQIYHNSMETYNAERQDVSLHVINGKHELYCHNV